MANQSSDYHRGEMDIHEQVQTYAFVMALTKWGSLATAAGILFLVLWFCTPAGFVGALAAAVVMIGLGVIFLRDRGETH